MPSPNIVGVLFAVDVTSPTTDNPRDKVLFQH